MAAGNVIFAVLIALVAVNFILAEKDLLELGDFAYDQVDGSENHGPLSEVNDNEQTKPEGRETMRPGLTKSCNLTRGPDYCVTCRKAVHCLSATIGIVTSCYDNLRYCNEGRCSATPGSQCKSG